MPNERSGTTDHQQLLTALTTEHFTLQTARAQTASESASRSSLFILAVSSTLVALGFMRNEGRPDQTFEVFALVVLSTVYVLGIFTYIRVVECGAEDYRYGVAINRIRHYYKEIAGDRADLFLLSGHDDGHGVFGNAAVPAEGRSQLFTFASVVALIDSVVGGSTIAAAVSSVPRVPLGFAAASGMVVGLASTVLFLRHGKHLLEARTDAIEAIFPTPEPENSSEIRTRRFDAT